MLKEEFLDRLKKALAGLPQAEIDERMSFYGEMLADRMEEGCPEEEAVAALGSPEEAAAAIIAETPLPMIVRERLRPKKKRSAWEITLLLLGAPLWLPLLAATVTVLIAVYTVLWACLLALWACDVALILALPGGIAAGILALCKGFLPGGLALIAGGLVCGGLAIFLFFGCVAATKAVIRLARLITLGIKHSIMKKEADV